MKGEESMQMPEERWVARGPIARFAGGIARPAVALLAAITVGSPLHGQDDEAGEDDRVSAPRSIDLTLDRMVELGLENSYSIRRLDLGVERRRSLLAAEQSELKSRVDMRISAPEYQAISDYRWNSDLGQDEIVYTNTQRWDLDISVRQPVILFGYPTNGYLSLNNRVYRYAQHSDDRDVRFYNRYFVAYEQPLFQPNRMKNDLEQARLDLEDAELDFQGDVIEIIDDLADDYFDLFEYAYERVIAESQVANLEQVAEAAAGVVAEDSSRAIELDQVQVEVANAREELEQASSGYRLQAAEIQQRLRLGEGVSLVVDPVMEIEPVEVKVEEAIGLARTLRPQLRQLHIDQREGELQLDEISGRNSFRVDLELTYGREMQDPRFQNLWENPTNSYTVHVDAYVPIWDWGARKQRMEAQRHSLRSTELRIEETASEIETSVRSQVRNLAEYETRAVAMQETLELARRNTASALERYRSNGTTLLDVLQSVNGESSTAERFLDAYLGYQNALLHIQELTYFDFVYEMPVLDRFGIQTSDDEDSRG